MFEPAILQSLEASMPPQPPATAQEQAYLSPAGEARQRVVQRLTESYDAQADAWIAKLDGIKAQFEPIVPAGPATPAEVANLDALIEDFETIAEDRAILSARFAKRTRRRVKMQFKIDASLAAVNRAAASRIVATDKRIAEALLDYALFLRALRAEGAGEAYSDAPYGDADDWQRRLDGMAA